VIPIDLVTVMKKLGHNKFKVSDLLAMEREILCSISYYIPSRSIYEEALVYFKLLITQNPIDKNLKCLIVEAIVFTSRLFILDHELQSHELQ
jgi:hypothetical protein